MPEGDTIYRTATVLRRALVGGVVRRAEAQSGPGLTRVPDLSVLVGASVEAVETRGKHLLIGFSGGRWLRTHMRMKGSWHRYRPGEPWRLPLRRAVCVLETDVAVAVCFDAPVVELLTDADLARHAALRSLGPDLLGEAPDLEEAVRRLRGRPTLALGEALLDQRNLAGIGTLWASESLFLAGVGPWTTASALTDPDLERVVTRAQQLLDRARRDGFQSSTGIRRRGEESYVHARSGRPCRRCGTTVRVAMIGPPTRERTMFYCPGCQGGVGPTDDGRPQRPLGATAGRSTGRTTGYRRS
jgi:endonuclease-8